MSPKYSSFEVNTDFRDLSSGTLFTLKWHYHIIILPLAYSPGVLSFCIKVIRSATYKCQCFNLLASDEMETSQLPGIDADSMDCLKHSFNLNLLACSFPWGYKCLLRE